MKITNKMKQVRESWLRISLTHMFEVKSHKCVPAKGLQWLLIHRRVLCSTRTQLTHNKTAERQSVHLHLAMGSSPDLEKY